MVSYFLNFMGPINRDWIIKNGNNWCGGRIDVSGLDYFEYYEGRTELGVPLMHAEDWRSFGNWLWEFNSESMLNLEQLVSIYERENPKIRWFEASA